MFDRFCFEDGVFQTVQFTNIKKKIPLSCFYLQLKFDNRELNCQPEILVWNIAEKTLYQVKFDHDFLEIYWLIESKVVSIIVPHQTKKYFFQ